jgi:glycosyltransferase involved in cell wall biosynthesis
MIMKNSFITVIIPSYNRADLIVETLKSIQKQTYKNWECIIVDDRSTDNTIAKLDKYRELDNRFLVLERPIDKPKGANSCRNYGLEHAKGDYVIFFDSDDLMTPNHIETKIDAITKAKSDYVITRTKFFNSEKGNEKLNKIYSFKSKDITHFNYVSQKINWLTYDICIKSDLAKSVNFNEELTSGQEYNYFSKLTLLSTNALFINEVVTLRRFHKDSIQGNLKDNKEKSVLGFYNAYLMTYKDIVTTAPRTSRQNLIYKCYRLAIKHKFLKRDAFKQLFFPLLKEYKFKGAYYIIKLM